MPDYGDTLFNYNMDPSGAVVYESKKIEEKAKPKVFEPTDFFGVAEWAAELYDLPNPIKLSNGNFVYEDADGETVKVIVKGNKASITGGEQNMDINAFIELISGDDAEGFLTGYEAKIEESLIYESFGSPILRDIILGNKNDKVNNIIGRISDLYLQLDKITDDDITKYDSSEFSKARKAAKDGAVIFWMSSGGKLKGVSYGNWVSMSQLEHVRGRRRFAPAYKSVLAVSKYSDHAYAVDGKKFDLKAIRDERWASKKDATAFIDNYHIKENNINRYKAIKSQLAADRAKGNLGIEPLEAIDTIMNTYNKMFKDLLGSPDWSKVQRIHEKIDKVMKLTEDYIWNVKNSESGKYYTDNLQKIIKEISKLLDEVNEYNAAQTE
jgi:hypothetical protein